MSTDLDDAAARRERLGRLLRDRTTVRTGPLSPAQQRLWFLEQLSPGDPTYHIPTVMRLVGRVDEEVLQQALDGVLARHEALRSVLYVDGAQVRQRVLPDASVRLTRLDVEPERLVDVLAQQARLPFDLTHGPLLRVALVGVGGGISYLAITVHHLVADGWSLLVLTRELSSWYDAAVHGRPVELPPVPLQYLDYIGWLQGQLAEGRFDRALEHFRAELADAPPWIDLPTDRQPGSGPSSTRGAVHRFAVHAATAQRLRALVAEEGATLYMGLLAAFGVLLHRLGGQPDVVVGTPIGNRPRLELEGAVGLFANVVVRRVRLGGRPSFRDVLGRVSSAVLADLEHQELPFERLVEVLNPPRDLDRNPIFQVMFSLQNLPTAPVPNQPPRPAAPKVTTGEAQFDLALTVQEAPDESGPALSCSLEYRAALFSGERVARMAEQLIRILEAAVAAPDLPVDRLPLLSPEQRTFALRLGDGGPPAAPAGSSGLFGLSGSALAAIAGLAASAAEDSAVTGDAGSLTFAGLEARVAAATARLAAAGVVPGEPVLVSAERDSSLVVALLALGRLGAIYLPVDPALPAARRRAMAAAVHARRLLAPDASADDWRDLGLTRIDPTAAGQPGTPPPEETAARRRPVDPIAYVIFTSGSTGTPKPVAVRWSAIDHHARALQSRYPLWPGDTVLLATGIGFDASLFELLGPLAAGARLAVLPGPGPYDADALIEAMVRHRVTALQVVPSMLQGLLDRPGLERCIQLRRVYCGGEALPAGLARRFRSRTDAELLNMYGPTETTVDATSWPVEILEGAAVVPIGRPIPGARALVLDDEAEPVPDGVTGELVVGGAGVALGYLGDPAATAERFRPDPHGPPGARAYWTGDLVRRRADGVLDFLGRRDDQVKLHGVRVELGEIDAALRRHPAVLDAATVLRTDGAGPRLAALVVAPGATEGQLRRHLVDELPVAMLPATIELVDALPLGPTGKLDRRAVLAALDRPTRPREHTPPGTDLERRIAALWVEVLGEPVVGRHDSFFDLGGHSLLATRLTSLVRDAFGVELPLRELFAQPTVAGTAAWVASHPPDPSRQ